MAACHLKWLAALAGPFSAPYLPIFALSSGVYLLYFEAKMLWSMQGHGMPLSLSLVPHERERERNRQYSILWHERRNRSGRPSDLQTSVCCMVPKKPADAISEILQIFTRFARIITYLRVSQFAGLKQIMEFLCKENGTTLHYVLVSFVLFHSFRS